MAYLDFQPAQPDASADNGAAFGAPTGGGGTTVVSFCVVEFS